MYRRSRVCRRNTAKKQLVLWILAELVRREKEVLVASEPATLVTLTSYAGRNYETESTYSRQLREMTCGHRR
jgi:hypothetical protein